MTQHNLTRRDMVRLFGGAVAAGAAFAVLNSDFVSAFADDGGGAGGGSGGTGAGGGASSYTLGEGAAWRWFDRGGFSRPGVQHIDPVQKWNDESKDWFWKNQVLPWMGFIAGKNWGVSLPMNGVDSSNHFGEATALAKYNAAADNALQAARDVAGEANARIVGVGWYYQIRDKDGGDWRLLYNGSNEGYMRDQHFTSLLKTGASPAAARYTPDLPTESIDSAHASEVNAIKGCGWGKMYYTKGTDGSIVRGGGLGNSQASLSSDAGWDLPVNVPGYVGKTWREYVYQQAVDTLKADDYVVVVVAVADGWPQKSGCLTATKTATF